MASSAKSQLGDDPVIADKAGRHTVSNTDYGYKALHHDRAFIYALSHLVRALLFLFWYFIRDSLPCPIISCTADEIAVLANENEKKNDNAVKARQGDKIAEKKVR
jgi:hypothetical protein